MAKKNTCPLTPLGDRVVVLTDEPLAQTKGGIVLPDRAQDRPTRGTVAAVGPGRLLDGGQRAPLQVAVGDRILFKPYEGQLVEHNETEWLVLREAEILAVV